VSDLRLLSSGSQPPSSDQRAAAGTDLLDGFVLTVLIAVAIGSIHCGIRVVRELRRCSSTELTIRK
jgi:hypothetical protein